MNTILTTIELQKYQKELASALSTDNYLVFVDTSFLMWGYRLNDEALQEFNQWLLTLASAGRLAIPAWVVHEFNTNFTQRSTSSQEQNQKSNKQLSAQLEVDPENRTSAEVVVLDLGGAGVNQNPTIRNESQTQKTRP